MDIDVLLIPKQKKLLELLVPGIEFGRIKGDLTIMLGAEGHGIAGLGSDTQLREIWSKAEEADFEVFVSRGFFIPKPQLQQHVLRFALDKGLILDAYKRGWKLPSKEANQVVNISTGDGSIINYQSTLTNVQQSIGSTPLLSGDAKAELTQLVGELKEALTDVSEDGADDAEVLVRHAEAAVNELNIAKPNKKWLQANIEGLEKAAKNLERILPPVVGIAVKIALVS